MVNSTITHTISTRATLSRLRLPGAPSSGHLSLTVGPLKGPVSELCRGVTLPVTDVAQGGGRGRSCARTRKLPSVRGLRTQTLRFLLPSPRARAAPRGAEWATPGPQPSLVSLPAPVLAGLPYGAVASGRGLLVRRGLVRGLLGPSRFHRGLQEAWLPTGCLAVKSIQFGS